jgi:hypothetical protein
LSVSYNSRRTWHSQSLDDKLLWLSKWHWAKSKSRFPLAPLCSLKYAARENDPLALIVDDDASMRNSGVGEQ